MAAHLQQQILVALAATLVAAGTAAGASVFVDRPDDLAESQLPAITMTPGPETVETSGMNLPYLQVRQFSLDICAICIGSGAAAAARDLGKQIEVALYASVSTATAGGLARPIELQSVAPSLSGAPAQIVAEIRQSWLVAYATLSGSPDASAQPT